ncbi:MAG: hypothetical protein NVS4B6_05650 [Mycobacterium sp.]
MSAVGAGGTALITGTAGQDGDPTKADTVLGWHSTFGFDSIVKATVSSDLRQEQEACG